MFVTIFGVFAGITEAVFVCVSSRYISAGSPLFAGKFYFAHKSFIYGYPASFMSLLSKRKRH
jgi:hypothetical protein